MKWVLIGAGLSLIGISVYTASDPMSRAQAWGTPTEWERNPERATEKQHVYTYVTAGISAIVGAIFVYAGLQW